MVRARVHLSPAQARVLLDFIEGEPSSHTLLGDYPGRTALHALRSGTARAEKRQARYQAAQQARRVSKAV